MASLAHGPIATTHAQAPFTLVALVTPVTPHALAAASQAGLPYTSHVDTLHLSHLTRSSIHH
jgi:hypothetical protein